MKKVRMVPKTVERVVEQVVENTPVFSEENDGLETLLGKKALFLCAGYFYMGILEGVNHTCVKFKECYVVYNSENFNPSKVGAKDRLPDGWYVSTQSIESFGPYDYK